MKELLDLIDAQSRIIDALTAKLADRPHCTVRHSTDDSSRRGRTLVHQANEFYLQVPQFQSVRIEYKDSVFEFISPAFTHVVNPALDIDEKIIVDVYTMADGTLKLAPDLSSWLKKTTQQKQTAALVQQTDGPETPTVPSAVK